MALLIAPFDIPSKPGLEIVLPMAAVKIYRGSAVGLVSGIGYATPLLVATSGILFQGVAEETVDNTVGNAGDLSIRIKMHGLVGFNSDTNINESVVGTTVYFKSGSDDNTVSATPSAVAAGTLRYIDSAGIAWVDIYAAATTTTVFSSTSYRTTAPATTTNVSGAAQTAATLTIAANTLKQYQRVRLRGQLKGVTRTASDTAAVVLKYGSTTIATLDGAFAHATTNFLTFDVTLQILTTGSGGTAVAYGMVSTGTAGATAAGVNMASTTFDTTVDEAFTVGVTFSASNTTDAISVVGFEAVIVN